ncbi:DUF4132 domain-containing protein [Paractinoplanes atraurantiacus]|uniref:DUF4132 domain-containing protein n=1 Tax=Paractinoplanes atraurantiacus TaxID=1036182 RepID=A0A285KD13_9ACTN|nr:DUF4132 domain-containing protein [Actinoplanes atraurantiacus]SNY70500.1 protein of unknown function [Actinoplanes atraurantiacus]
MASGEGLVCADPTVMAWEEGERERWLARAALLEHGREEDGWTREANNADRLSDLSPMQVPWLFAKGPEAAARAMLAGPMLLRQRQRLDIGRVAVARFEVDALKLALGLAGESADRLGSLLLPFRGPEPAALVAGWLRHLGSARLWARLWLQRHATVAAQALMPVALGKPGRARQNAEDALHHLRATGHEATLLKVAAGKTAKPRKMPDWARPERLPGVRRIGGGMLGEDEVGRLIEGLTRSRLEDAPEPAPGDPAPGGRAVESSAAAQPEVRAPDPEILAGCDRHSLAEFGRALLDQWLTDDMPASEAWVLLAQAHLGDDSTMDKLAPLIRSWPARSRWARAIDGLAVLATAGTDVALRHLLAMEERMSGGPTNDRALVYLTQAAARRGLSVTQLADRLAATHDLGRGVTLDYGPRSFTVVLDDHLTPHVVGADGRRLAKPPKPGVKDFKPESFQDFVRLKKELRLTVSAQTARLERDMLAHRVRPAAGVRAPHPILGPLARRLLWAEPGRRLRIAEDGSFADVHDATARVDDDAVLRIVHPAELEPAELADWRQIFADYEILQPFPQLNRPFVALTEEQRAATSLPGFGPVATGAVVGLLNRGWLGNGFHNGTRLHTQLAHALPGDLTLLIEVDPGVSTSSLNSVDEQRITEIWIDDAGSDHWQVARTTPMGAGDAAALSELLTGLDATLRLL